MFLRRWNLIITLLFVVSGGLLVRLAQAQTGDAPWLPAVNLSNSGAASQPLIATASDNVLHALWWDSTLGTLYARTTDASQLSWTEPEPVPDILGRRVQDTQTGEETIFAPRDMRLLADASENVYAFWYDSTDRLLSSMNNGSSWSNPAVVAEKALLFDATADPGGQMQVVYVRPIDAPNAPAGIYHRSASGGNWGSASLVDSSAYYRTLKPEQAHVSIAGSEAGTVLVAWDKPPLNQSVLARSTDQGTTWSAPQPVAGAPAAQAGRARVAFGPGSEFLLHWQDAGASGCGLTQSRSSDEGQTWTAPEVILSALTRCDGMWSFASDQAGRLWLLSRAAGPGANGIKAAVWDGEAWSEPRDVTFAFFDDRTQLSTNLNCLNLSIAGEAAGLIGCDAGGDVWATRNAIGLEQWLPSLQRVWSEPLTLSTQASVVAPDSVPDVTADSQGRVYTVWSQLTSDGLGTDLFSAVWRDGRWSGASRLSTTGTLDEDSAAAADAPQADQPAIATDNRDRVHVVWSDGAAGEILYSWAYARDLGSGQRWNETTRLSPTSMLGQWPDIVADSRSDDLYVIYTLPFNEQRGVYLSVSTDDGQSWQTPVKIFDAEAAGWSSVDRARLALDAENQRLHAVWLRRALPGQSQSQEVYYAASSDGGQNWTAPTQVAAGAVDGPQVIVPAAGQVYLAWCQADTVGPNVRGQFSPDGGQRWSAPVQINQFEQVSCPVSLATDGLGQMHLAGMTHNAGGESVLLTARWNGQTWTVPESYGLGQRSDPGNVAAIALVPQADRLSATVKLWSKQADTSEHFEIVATDRSSPAVGVLSPAPTFTPMPTPTASPTATPLPTATVKPQLTDRALMPPSAGGGPPPLVLGGALAAVIVVIIVARIIWVKRR
jgi:hypothetical protein